MSRNYILIQYHKSKTFQWHHHPIKYTKKYVCIVISYHSLHHVGLVVPQGFNSVENIYNILLLDHLIDAADGTESSRTSTTSSVRRRNKGVGPRNEERKGDRGSSVLNIITILETQLEGEKIIVRSKRKQDGMR